MTCWYKCLIIALSFWGKCMAGFAMHSKTPCSIEEV
jgi:hypothetical protein